MASMPQLQVEMTTLNLQKSGMGCFLPSEELDAATQHAHACTSSSSTSLSSERTLDMLPALGFSKLSKSIVSMDMFFKQLWHSPMAFKSVGVFDIQAKIACEICKQTCMKCMAYIVLYCMFFTIVYVYSSRLDGFRMSTFVGVITACEKIDNRVHRSRKE